MFITSCHSFEKIYALKLAYQIFVTLLSLLYFKFVGCQNISKVTAVPLQYTYSDFLFFKIVLSSKNYNSSFKVADDLAMPPKVCRMQRLQKYIVSYRGHDVRRFNTITIHYAIIEHMLRTKTPCHICHH